MEALHTWILENKGRRLFLPGGGGKVETEDLCAREAFQCFFAEFLNSPGIVVTNTGSYDLLYCRGNPNKIT